MQNQKPQLIPNNTDNKIDYVYVWQGPKSLSSIMVDVKVESTEIITERGSNDPIQSKEFVD